MCAENFGQKKSKLESKHVLRQNGRGACSSFQQVSNSLLFNLFSVSLSSQYEQVAKTISPPVTRRQAYLR